MEAFYKHHTHIPPGSLELEEAEAEKLLFPIWALQRVPPDILMDCVEADFDAPVPTKIVGVKTLQRVSASIQALFPLLSKTQRSRGRPTKSKLAQEEALQAVQRINANKALQQQHPDADKAHRARMALTVARLFFGPSLTSRAFWTTWNHVLGLNPTAMESPARGNGNSNSGFPDKDCFFKLYYATLHAWVVRRQPDDAADGRSRSPCSVAAGLAPTSPIAAKFGAVLKLADFQAACESLHLITSPDAEAAQVSKPPEIEHEQDAEHFPASKELSQAISVLSSGTEEFAKPQAAKSYSLETEQAFFRQSAAPQDSKATPGISGIPVVAIAQPAQDRPSVDLDAEMLAMDAGSSLWPESGRCAPLYGQDDSPLLLPDDLDVWSSVSQDVPHSVPSDEEWNQPCRLSSKRTTLLLSSMGDAEEEEEDQDEPGKKRLKTGGHFITLPTGHSVGDKAISQNADDGVDDMDDEQQAVVDDVPASIASVHANARAQARLSPDNWLNDEVIVAVAELASACRPHMYAPSFSFTANRTNTFFDDFYRQRVQDWKAGRQLQAPVFLLPLNINESHWITTWVDPGNKRCLIFDSLLARHPEFSQEARTPLQQFINAVFRDDKDYEDSTSIGWDIRDVATWVSQENGVDCGVFACAAMLLLAANDFEADHADEACAGWMATFPSAVIWRRFFQTLLRVRQPSALGEHSITPAQQIQFDPSGGLGDHELTSVSALENPLIRLRKARDLATQTRNALALRRNDCHTLETKTLPFLRDLLMKLLNVQSAMSSAPDWLSTCLDRFTIILEHRATALGALEALVPSSRGLGGPEGRPGDVQALLLLQAEMKRDQNQVKLLQRTRKMREWAGSSMENLKGQVLRELAAVRENTRRYEELVKEYNAEIESQGAR